MLSVGDKAIPFTAKNQDGQDISLDQYKGKKIILYFYPKDNTPGCTTEACGLRDVYDEILEKGAVVLGVSPDTEASHERFRRKYDLPFHLIADPEHRIAEAYGAWGEKKRGQIIRFGIKRITYLIDEQGMIERAWPKVSPKSHAGDILKALNHR